MRRFAKLKHIIFRIRTGCAFRQAGTMPFRVCPIDATLALQPARAAQSRAGASPRQAPLSAPAYAEPIGSGVGTI